jgi:hypothetical protein
MVSLDILTPRGQESLRQERILLDAVSKAYGFDILETAKDQPCEVDGFLARDGVICGVFESKCRKLTRAQMRKFDDRWLVTFEKVLAGLRFSKLLMVPFYGLVYLTEEPVGLMIQISDATGSPIVNMEVAQTTTQRTVNGGTIQRANAYIDLDTAFEFPVE